MLGPVIAYLLKKTDIRGIIEALAGETEWPNMGSAPKEQLPRKLSGKRTAGMNAFRRAVDDCVSWHTEGASGRFREDGA